MKCRLEWANRHFLGGKTMRKIVRLPLRILVTLRVSVKVIVHR